MITPALAVLFSLAAALTASPALAQSLDVGDEVIFSGGPAQPPQSRQTGTSIHYSNLRFGGGPASPAGPPAKDGSAGRQGVAALEPEPPPKPPPPLVAYELAGAPRSKLVQLLRASNQPVDRFSAARALGQTAGPAREAAVPPLLEALGDEDLRVTAEAARSLAALREPRAVKPLVELLNQSDPQLLEAVIGALGDLGDRSAVEPLRAFADSSGSSLDVAARAALGKLGR